MERIGRGQACGTDGGAQVALAISGPFGALAVGDFALDGAGPQYALADVVGGINLFGKVAESEQLVARASDLAEQFMRQYAVSGSV